MLYIKLIIKLDKRQIEANSDCPEHNVTDVNCPVCVQVGILMPSKSGKDGMSGQ